MKVLNLQCAHQHSFEGWFASEDDFQSQLARRLVECPLCADGDIRKLPSAPRLNLGAHPLTTTQASNSDKQAHPNGSVTPSDLSGSSQAVRDLQVGPGRAEAAAFLKALRHVVANTEDVGTRFADEARAMHYGDAQARNIRGQASMREAIGLLEEGIEVMPLPMPAALKETLQ